MISDDDAAGIAYLLGCRLQDTHWTIPAELPKNFVTKAWSESIEHAVRSSAGIMALADLAKKLQAENAELKKRVEDLEERGRYLQERFEENRNTTL